MKKLEANNSSDNPEDLKFSDLSNKVVNFLADKLENNEIEVVDMMFILRILGVANTHRSLEVVINSFAEKFVVLSEFLELEGEVDVSGLGDNIAGLVDNVMESGDTSAVSKIVSATEKTDK